MQPTPQPLPHGLSAALIVRDAERFLPACLDSARDLVDEIVVVDTGSSDRSLAIACERGCRTFELPWTDDFSAARNFALQQARFSWILSLDADEVIADPAAGEKLRRACSQPASPAYIIYQDNLLDSGRVEEVPVLRLFWNHTSIYFRNPVHESIGEALLETWPAYVPPTVDLHLRHYGHLRANARGKHERNLALLRRWVAEHPENIYARYKLGMTLREVQQGEAGLRQLSETFRLFDQCKDRGTYPFIHTFARTYYGDLRAHGRQREAEVFRERAESWR